MLILRRHDLLRDDLLNDHGVVGIPVVLLARIEGVEVDVVLRDVDGLGGLLLSAVDHFEGGVPLFDGDLAIIEGLLHEVLKEHIRLVLICHLLFFAVLCVKLDNGILGESNRVSIEGLFVKSYLGRELLAWS